MNQIDRLRVGAKYKRQDGSVKLLKGCGTVSNIKQCDCHKHSTSALFALKYGVLLQLIVHTDSILSVHIPDAYEIGFFLIAV